MNSFSLIFRAILMNALFFGGFGLAQSHTMDFQRSGPDQAVISWDAGDLETTTDLTQPWEQVTTGIQGNEGNYTYIITFADAPAQFFRVSVTDNDNNGHGYGYGHSKGRGHGHGHGKGNGHDKDSPDFNESVAE